MIVGSMMRYHVAQINFSVMYPGGRKSCHHNHEISVSAMLLELHTWGPAFGLPSIEPECIATIAYCQRVIPKGQWTLTADYDSTVGASGMQIAQCIGFYLTIEQRACRYYTMMVLRRLPASKTSLPICAIISRSRRIWMLI